jgi:hypothetical protein
MLDRLRSKIGTVIYKILVFTKVIKEKTINAGKVSFNLNSLKYKNAKNNKTIKPLIGWFSEINKFGVKAIIIFGRNGIKVSDAKIYILWNCDISKKARTK